MLKSKCLVLEIVAANEKCKRAKKELLLAKERMRSVEEELAEHTYLLLLRFRKFVRKHPELYEGWLFSSNRTGRVLRASVNDKKDALRMEMVTGEVVLIPLEWVEDEDKYLETRSNYVAAHRAALAEAELAALEQKCAAIRATLNKG